MFYCTSCVVDSVVTVTCSTVNVDDLEVTHRGCHKFIPRHSDEIFIQIGDPIYVEAEHEDLWCQGSHVCFFAVWVLQFGVKRLCQELSLIRLVS